MKPSAVLDESRHYRYLLNRRWQSGGDIAVFIMLNPSTADERHDDPTIRRCYQFAADNGYGALAVVNLFAFRATKPKDLVLASDPIGPQNDMHIIQAVRDSSVVIAAWGAEKPFSRPRARAVERLIAEDHVILYCLGLTRDGCPRHPLYVRGGTSLIPYRRVEEGKR